MGENVLKRFSGSLSDRFEQLGGEHDGIFTQEARQEKPESVLLSQLHLEVSAKVGWNDITLAPWSLSTCFKLAAADAEFWASLETNFSG